MSLGFIGGLGAAMQGYTEASKDWEKREQASAAEQRRVDEHTYSQQKRQIEMDEIERAKTIRNETEAAAKPLEVQAQEILPPEDDPFTPRQTVYKVGDQTFTDEAKAKVYATDPYEAAKRTAGVKLKYGDVGGSLSIGQQIMRAREDSWVFADKEKARPVQELNDQITGILFDPKDDFWNNGAKILGKWKNDGTVFKPEKQANGTIIMNKYAPDGTLLGQHGEPITDDYAGQRKFANGFIAAPDWKTKKTELAELINADAEQRKNRRAEVKDKTDIGLAKARTQESIAKVNGTGYFAKEPKKPKADAISEGFKNFSPDNKAGRAEGENLARQAKPLNPGATDQELIYAAQTAVVEGPDSPNIKPRLDMNTGQVMAVFTDPRTGKQIKLHQSRITPDAATPEQKLSLKTEVQAYLAGQDKLGSSLGSQAKWSDALKRAAANPKDSDAIDEVVMQKAAAAIETAKANVLQRRQTEIAQGKPPTPIPSNPMEFHEQVMQSLIKNYRSPGAQALINKQLSLIRTYGLN